jgi:hypothetical protein
MPSASGALLLVSHSLARSAAALPTSPPVPVHPLAGAQRLLNFDAFESIAWTLRKRLHHDIAWPSDWEEGCREVSRYFASNPLGSGEWAPWANYEFDAPPPR